MTKVISGLSTLTHNLTQTRLSNYNQVALRLFKILFFGGAILTWVGLISWWALGDTLKRSTNELQGEVLGGLASRYIAKHSAEADTHSAVKTVASLHHIEIKVDRFGSNIFRASGVANSYLIQTDEGNVLFDAGLATQAAKHKRLLQAAAPGVLTHIILSHSHADHIGATKFWRAEFPDAKIITHRRFIEGQRYLADLQKYFWGRNRRLYTFTPPTPPDEDSLFAYGGLQPDFTVENRSEHRFTQGGVEFVVLPTPGAEGDDNIVLWLPQQKALFGGDFFGPLFPMVPNLFTLRGEKFRDPIDYIRSLNQVIALKPDIILPGHFDPYLGAEDLNAKMIRIRDATAYIHDETIQGMNAGKSVWQLMQEIQLPKHLSLSQGHGKVSWNVRSIWEHYSTWFQFNSTTELYPVPVSSLYAELADMAGGAQTLADRAATKLSNKHPEQALHLLEMALAAVPNHRQALQVRLQTLQTILKRAQTTSGNFSEIGWLESQIATTEVQLENL